MGSSYRVVAKGSRRGMTHLEATATVFSFLQSGGAAGPQPSRVAKGHAPPILAPHMHAAPSAAWAAPVLAARPALHRLLIQHVGCPMLQPFAMRQLLSEAQAHPCL